MLVKQFLCGAFLFLFSLFKKWKKQQCLAKKSRKDMFFRLVLVLQLR